MANPADLLLNLFNKWNHDSNSAQHTRDDPNLEMHIRAIHWVEQIEELLDRLDSTGAHTEVYRRYLPEWKKTIFVLPNGWGGSETARISQTQRDHLSTLAFALQGVVFSPDEDQVQKLKDYLGKVLANLAEDTSLNKVTRDSATTVVTNLLACIDDLAVLGDFEFEKAYERLIGSLAVVTLKSEQRDRWVRVFQNLVYPYVVNNLPSVDDASHTIGMLMGS